jgi:hypothetical protein
MRVTAAREQHLVRAHALGGLQLAGIGVHGDDRGRRAERSHRLDGHLAQTADPDHHRGRARPQQVHRSLDGVIAGQPRAAERGGLARVEGAQRNQESRCRDQQVLSHSAVVTASQAAALTTDLLAVVLPALPAVGAHSTAPGAVDHHRVSRREPGDTRSQLLHLRYCPAEVHWGDRRSRWCRPGG